MRREWNMVMLRRTATVLLVAVSACHGSTEQPKPTPLPFPLDAPVERHVGLGIACRMRWGMTYGAPSFSARDASRADLPASDLATLHRIQHYAHAPTLRYAYLDAHFAVFDAVDGACGSKWYPVLNGRNGKCGSWRYNPAEGQGAASGCFELVKRSRSLPARRAHP